MDNPELLQQVWFEYYGHIEQGTIVKVQKIDYAEKGYSKQSEDGSFQKTRYFIHHKTLLDVVFNPHKDNPTWNSRRTIDAEDAFSTSEELKKSLGYEKI